MNGDGLHYGIRAGLPRRFGTPAIIGARFVETLDTLSETDPLLARWMCSTSPQWRRCR